MKSYKELYPKLNFFYGPYEKEDLQINQREKSMSDDGSPSDHHERRKGSKDAKHKHRSTRSKRATRLGEAQILQTLLDTSSASYQSRSANKNSRQIRKSASRNTLPSKSGHHDLSGSVENLTKEQRRKILVEEKLNEANHEKDFQFMKIDDRIFELFMKFGEQRQAHRSKEQEST